jgi:hypothetical protein
VEEVAALKAACKALGVCYHYLFTHCVRQHLCRFKHADIDEAELLRQHQFLLVGAVPPSA